MIENQRHLKEIEAFLTAIAGRILQVSNRKAGAALGAATSTIAGSAFATSVIGVVGVYGSASTGAAIAGLAGAAKTNATLYWIGSLVGGGVAAGSLMLGAGAVGVGVYGSVKLRKAIFGHSRKDTLSEHEQIIILSLHALTQAIRSRIDSESSIPDREVILFSRIGVIPLLEDIKNSLDCGDFSEIKFYNRVRLRGHIINLHSLLREFDF